MNDRKLAAALLAGILMASPALAQQDRLRNNPEVIRVLLSAQTDTVLSAQMAGRIISLPVSLGAAVPKDSMLVEFDCSETEAHLKMAQAESSGAQETLRVKQRLRELSAAGDSEVVLARADVRRAAANIELVRAQLAYCKVTAPFDARVAKIIAKPFQSVSAGAPLLELVSRDELKLRMNVPSRLLDKARIGAPLEVHINETGANYSASVTAVNARVDAVAQTIELEARLNDAPDELLPGMTGAARFTE